MHELYMEMALREAEQAMAEDEVPVGAVIVHEGTRVIASSHNQREQLRDPTAHAEMIAITQAAESLNDWRLENCALYVTLEPCYHLGKPPNAIKSLARMKKANSKKN